MATRMHAVELEAYWLTLPAVAGAKVTVTSSATSSSEVSASFTIAGIGGGPTFTLDLKEEVGFEATTPERVTLSAVGTFDLVRVSRSGQVIANYALLRALDRDNLNWTRTELRGGLRVPSARTLPLCGDAISPVPRLPVDRWLTSQFKHPTLRRR